MLPNLNNTNLTSTFNSWASTDWTNFASDMTSSFTNAWSLRFTLTARQTLVLNAIPAFFQQQIIALANYVAAALTSGYLVNLYGTFFDTNPSGGSTYMVHGHVTPDFKWDPATGKTTVSGSIEIDF